MLTRAGHNIYFKYSKSDVFLMKVESCFNDMCQYLNPHKCVKRQFIRPYINSRLKFNAISDQSDHIRELPQFRAIFEKSRQQNFKKSIFVVSFMKFQLTCHWIGKFGGNKFVILSGKNSVNYRKLSQQWNANCFPPFYDYLTKNASAGRKFWKKVRELL